MNYYDLSIFYTETDGDKCVRHFYGLPEILVAPVINQFQNITDLLIDEPEKWKLPPLKFEIK